MPDLVLTEREQNTLQSLYARSPVPGSPIPAVEVLNLVNSLIPSDALGASHTDYRGTMLEQITLPRWFREGDDDVDDKGPYYVGIMHWSRNPEAAESCKALSPGTADGVAIGFRNGPDNVSQLWLDRERRMFSDRDLAMLRLISPVLQRHLRERPTRGLPATLTVQERRVLVHVAAGQSNSDIAADLFIAPSTVRKHLEHSFRKLGVTSRLSAVAALRGSDLPDQDLRERVERLG
jgi:DNA-binding CsgD family transcriptional regulator